MAANRVHHTESWDLEQISVGMSTSRESEDMKKLTRALDMPQREEQRVCHFHNWKKPLRKMKDYIWKLKRLGRGNM